MPSCTNRLDRLRGTVRSFGSAAVAFSGGADSALVARIAHEELGDMTVAVTIDSVLLPRHELEQAKRVAESIGIDHVIIVRDPLSEARFSANPENRCHLCKLADMTLVRGVADEKGFVEVLDGVNSDDLHDYRPGLKAREELGIRSPLAENMIGKEDVRCMSRELGLETHDRPATPCLATRIPYGEIITAEKLERIEKAEAFLRGEGFQEVRVRSHGDLARIEVAPADLTRIADPRMFAEITKMFKSIGFVYVTLDMEGYRMGSMNEVLGR